MLFSDLRAERFSRRVDQSLTSGVRVSPNGVDFSYQRLGLGDAVGVRATGTLLFPRELPVVEGDPWLQPRL